MDGRGRGDMMERRLLEAAIACPSHPKRQDSLRPGPCDTGPAFGACLQGLGLLAFPGRLHGQGLRWRRPGQRAWAGFATATASSACTGGTGLVGKKPLHRRCAARPFGRFPVLARLPHGAGDVLMIPVKKKVADIIRVLIVRLPALILAHRPGAVQLLGVLTAHELCPGEVRASPQVDGGP